MKRFKRVNIEISNVCNLRCSFCPEVHREAQFMKVELFRSILAQVAPLTEEVCLHLMGEPLAHPRLGEIVEGCAELGVPVNLTSNGTLLNESRKEILLLPIVRQVNFSVHSFEANFGERDVLPYMKRIFAFTREALARRPELYINYRIWDLRDPVSLTPASTRIREAIRDEFGFELDPASVDLRRKKGYRIAGRLYLSLDSRFEWPSPQAPLRSVRGYCHGLSNHFGIHADGTVVPCCLDKEAVLSLGSCQTRPIEEILAGERATRIAHGFERGECVEDLCRRCDFIQRFDRKARTEIMSG